MSIQPFSIGKNEHLFRNISGLYSQHDTLCFTGCTGSYDAFLICNIFQTTENTVFVLPPDTKQAEILLRECSSLVGEKNVFLFPSRDAIPYNMRSPFGPTIETRFQALSKLIDGEKKIYIAPSATLMQKILPPKELFNHIIKLHTNDEISQEKLASWLSGNGFSRETVVEDIGTFAIRGGIVDIYPFLSDNPIRLEYWGDIIESIRKFDVFKQRSVETCATVDIFPMKEFCLNEYQVDCGLKKIETQCMQNNENINSFNKLKHLWKSQTEHEGIEWFLHWFDQPEATILDYLPSDCMVVWDDIFPLNRRYNDSYQNYERHLVRIPETFLPFVSKPDTLLVPIKKITEKLSSYRRVFINTDMVPENVFTHSLSLQEQPSFNSSLKMLARDLLNKEADGYSISIFCQNSTHAQHFVEQLEGEGCTVNVTIGYLEKGFVDQQNENAFYSENQFFSRPYRIMQRKKAKGAVQITSLDSLLPGSFVVHIDHGIARFSGVERIQTAGTQQDCMVLMYQNNAKVYVPIEDFYKVQKYIGKDSAAPLLSKLGTSRWEKQKAKARESLKEMAENLVQLYAKRECLEGIKFSRDTVWQKEFEEAFIYEPTADQISAFSSVKKDMESLRPMDRLVCGDVGFGKTEIAMRAAFKAALDGYQVAILAPTTILAAQHYTTFCDRMADHPVNITVLSRFVKTKEQKESLTKLKNGTINIAIGTHRLLSRDIEFKNLGLLIIDEEQRFGVRHKERLKEYRYNVDVLSMTATPIPRTMHMSLIGIRDLSIVNTPPRNRLPIETHVMEYHEEVIKNAIENELDRGGQVYVVDNRIRNLPELQNTIELSVPRARIIAAHGQMDEKKLQRVMKEFVAGKYDVLLSTAIIESGLDIPNVNTIIVSRAETLGLSQLYQLRGRVGRSSEQAYAYFLTRSFKHIKEISLKRLRALEQYTDLGSGFQIAMRDLEIRGAGNILGTDQHGTIAAVGFELYYQLLKEEIDKIKGQRPEGEKKEVKINIPVNAYIPAEYIADSATRISLYQECSACKKMDDISDLKRNFVDRFGPLPLPIQTLLAMMQLKVLGQTIGISHLVLGQDNLLSISFHHKEEPLARLLKNILSKTSRPFEVLYTNPIVLKTALSSKNALDRLFEIKDVLETQIAQLME